MSCQLLWLNMWLSITTDNNYSDTQSWLNLINYIPWLNLISSSLWLVLISFSLWYDLITSYSLTWFNYFESASLILLNCSHLHPPAEGGKRRSQLYSRELYWLGPYLTQNTWGRYIPILSVEFVMLNPPAHKLLYSYLILDTFCAKVIIICICYIVQRATGTPIQPIKTLRLLKRHL